MNQNLGEGICNIEHWQALESKIHKLLRQLPGRYFVKRHEQTLNRRRNVSNFISNYGNAHYSQNEIPFYICKLWKKECSNKNCCIGYGSMRTLIHCSVPSVLEKQLSICLPNNPEILCIVSYIQEISIYLLQESCISYFRQHYFIRE